MPTQTKYWSRTGNSSSDWAIVLRHFMALYPEGQTSIEFDQWSVDNGISCDNSKRRLRELKEAGLIEGEWESRGGKRYKRYRYVRPPKISEEERSKQLLMWAAG